MTEWELSGPHFEEPVGPFRDAYLHKSYRQRSINDYKTRKHPLSWPYTVGYHDHYIPDDPGPLSYWRFKYYNTRDQWDVAQAHRDMRLYNMQLRNRARILRKYARRWKDAHDTFRWIRNGYK